MLIRRSRPAIKSTDRTIDDTVTYVSYKWRVTLFWSTRPWGSCIVSLPPSLHPTKITNYFFKTKTSKRMRPILHVPCMRINFELMYRFYAVRGSPTLQLRIARSLQDGDSARWMTFSRAIPQHCVEDFPSILFVETWHFHDSIGVKRKGHERSLQRRTASRPISQGWWLRWHQRLQHALHDYRSNRTHAVWWLWCRDIICTYLFGPKNPSRSLLVRWLAMMKSNFMYLLSNNISWSRLAQWLATLRSITWVDRCALSWPTAFNAVVTNPGERSYMYSIISKCRSRVVQLSPCGDLGCAWLLEQT